MATVALYFHKCRSQWIVKKLPQQGFLQGEFDLLCSCLCFVGRKGLELTDRLKTEGSDNSY